MQQFATPFKPIGFILGRPCWLGVRLRVFGYENTPALRNPVYGLQGGGLGSYWLLKSQDVPAIRYDAIVAARKSNKFTLKDTRLLLVCVKGGS